MRTLVGGLAAFAGLLVGGSARAATGSPAEALTAIMGPFWLGMKAPGSTGIVAGYGIFGGADRPSPGPGAGLEFDYYHQITLRPPFFVAFGSFTQIQLLGAKQGTEDDSEREVYGHFATGLTAMIFCAGIRVGLAARTPATLGGSAFGLMIEPSLDALIPVVPGLRVRWLIPFHDPNGERGGRYYGISVGVGAPVYGPGKELLKRL